MIVFRLCLELSAHEPITVNINTISLTVAINHTRPMKKTYELCLSQRNLNSAALSTVSTGVRLA